MSGPKTNEREGTRAVLRYSHMSAYKVRQVIDVIRNRPVHEAADLLRFVERDAALVVEKLLRSAVANAVNNDGLDAEELYVSACFADEGPTAKRWRPRARGRATRIRKRSCHITIIVSRLPEERLVRLQARRQAENLAMRSRRVEATRRARAESAEGASRRERRHPEAFATGAEGTTEEASGTETDETTTDETTTDETAIDATATEAPEDTTEAEVTGASDDVAKPDDTEAAVTAVSDEAPDDEAGSADADEEKDS